MYSASSFCRAPDTDIDVTTSAETTSASSVWESWVLRLLLSCAGGNLHTQEVAGELLSLMAHSDSCLNKGLSVSKPENAWSILGSLTAGKGELSCSY